MTVGTKPSHLSFLRSGMLICHLDAAVGILVLAVGHRGHQLPVRGEFAVTRPAESETARRNDVANRAPFVTKRSSRSDSWTIQTAHKLSWRLDWVAVPQCQKVTIAGHQEVGLGNYQRRKDRSIIRVSRYIDRN